MKRPQHPYISASAQQLLATYRAALQERGDLQGTTIRNYLSDLHHFVAWCEASWQEGLFPDVAFRLSDLTTPLIAQYRAYLLTILRLKPASINRMLISIKRFSAWATERNMLGSDPARPVPLVAQPQPQPRFLSDAEEQRLLATVATAAPLRDRAIVVTLLRAGLRVQELCALPIEHVDLTSQGSRILVAGAGAGAREVPLDPLTRDTLSLYVPTRPTGAVPLFVGPDAQQPLTPRTVGRIVHNYASQAELGDLSPQDLRNRYGFRIAQALPLPEVARLLGHTSLISTVRYFAAPGAPS
ncbi:MAG TPA: tyrosine-type recombinase/integrase [Ktedonobacterales bacterium]|nr:tyrosine-type recombinase/integrase [Ktedonobacterales bacterium]